MKRGDKDKNRKGIKNNDGRIIDKERKKKKEEGKDGKKK